MCGRFTQTRPEADLALRFALTLPLAGLDLRPRYNVAPGQGILGIRAGSEGRRAELYRWGFTPAWLRDGKGPAPINARSETAATSRLFGPALRRRRLLIPADGFYEWRREADGGKTPMRFTVDGGALFAFAGLWEPPAAEGAPPTCAILTTRPNALAAGIHDRQPVVLRPEHEAVWLEGAAEPAELAAACEPFPAPRMAVHPVSTVVNSGRFDGPECIRPVG